MGIAFVWTLLAACDGKGSDSGGDAGGTDEADTDTDSDPDTVTGTDCVELTWHPDADGDGYGSAGLDVDACTQPSGHVADGTDCDDDDAAVHPGMEGECADCDAATECFPNGEVTAEDGDIVWWSSYGGYSGVGISLSPAGDVDGDGKDDVIVGADGGNAHTEGGGAAFLVSGPTTKSGELDLGIASAELYGDEGDQAGWSVSGAGDLDSDGYDDLVVGAPGSALGGVSSGAVYLVFGPVAGELSLGDSDAILVGESASHFGSDVAVVGDVGGDARADLLVGAETTGEAFLFHEVPDAGMLDTSVATTRYVGDWLTDDNMSVVASVGDFDGDGRSDVGVGAPGYPWTWDYGCVHLYYDEPTAKDTTMVDADFQVCGLSAFDEAATSFEGVGDVDGDGFDDLLVGAPGAEHEGKTPAVFGGTIHLVLGGPDVTGTMQDLTDHSQAWWEAESSDQLAGFAVAAAGDVDADGTGDLLMSAVDYDVLGAHTGSAYLTDGQDLEGRMSVRDTNLWIRGAKGGQYTGWSVSGIGDLNDDGFADIAVGSPGPDGGFVSVFLGTTY